MENGRDKSYDFIKGVLIAFVVWGHVCAFSAGAGYDKNILTTYIRLFQMPVFVFISGYFQKEIKTGMKGLIQYFVKMFLSLVVPFLFFCFLAMLVNRGISNVLPEPVSLSLGSFWFFPCIILCKVIASLIMFLVPRKGMRYAIYGMIAGFPLLVDFDLFFFSFLWVFFAVGLVLKQECINPISNINLYVKNKNRKFCVFLCTLSVVALLLGYFFPTRWTFYNRTNYLLGHGTSDILQTMIFVVYRYVVYFLESAWAFCMLTVLAYIMRKKFGNKINTIQELGTKTQFIYGMHMVILKFAYEPIVSFLSHGKGIIESVLIRDYVLATVITIMLLYFLQRMSQLLQKVPVLRTIMLGEIGKSSWRILKKG